MGEPLTASRRIGDIVVVAVLLGFSMAVIALMWARPWLLSLLLVAPPVALAVRLRDPRRALALALTGMALGPLTESLCIMGGLWSYAATGGLPLVPPWIFPLWACFPATLWLVATAVTRREPAVPWRADHAAMALAALALEIVVFVRFGHDTVLALAVASPLAAAILVASRRREIVVAFLVGGVLGPLAESPAIAAGAWSYPHAELLGMPLWLPLGYCIFASLIALVSEQVSAALGARRSRAQGSALVSRDA